MSALRLIRQDTVSAAIRNIDLTDIFNDDFDVYKIVATGIKAAANTRIDAYFIDTAGGVITGDYNNAALEIKGDTSYNEQKNNLAYIKNIGYCGADGDGGFVMHIFNPYDSTLNTHFISESYGGFTGDSSTHDNVTYRGAGVLKENSSVGGIRIEMDSQDTAGTLGRVAVYGYRID
tara:strand:+ start:654 stop:1181 length:528 start_codon:yes stop_codon:yes gene_type:complete